MIMPFSPRQDPAKRLSSDSLNPIEAIAPQKYCLGDAEFLHPRLASILPDNQLM